MVTSRNPFEHLIPNNGTEQNVSEHSTENPFKKLIPPEQKEEMIDTFMGKLPRHPKEWKTGNPELKKELEGYLNAAVGGPGLKLVGQGVGGFGKGILSILNRQDPKELAYGVQKAHDSMLNKLSSMYDYIKDQAIKRKIGNIKIPDQLFEQAEKHLPKTEPYKDLINNAKNGDYESLHKLQSDLGKKGTAAKGAKMHAERNIGEEMLDTRKQINNKIQSHLKETGNKDLADILGEASNGYKKYKKLYYTDRGIANMVHEENRLVPKNPFNLFSKESKPMSRIIEAHPEIGNALKNEKTAKDFLKGLNRTGKIGAGLGIGGGALYGYNAISNLLNHLSGE